ncbi:hypothetical protein BN874_1680030 [Candidatus Contendobacter odensis Run_B_J11]|uniref:Uncharacterized protein n=1 Tax=Candidatus Contendobacter odensis Run_B_J11 TaxID=1400861 RepID=A0A7U7J3K7_9GAMM|nr:hypothetical protein BN874_1680030 [Candidatus Contendobacter odensis Run_B_J11]
MIASPAEDEHDRFDGWEPARLKPATPPGVITVIKDNSWGKRIPNLSIAAALHPGVARVRTLKQSMLLYLTPDSATVLENLHEP